MRNHDEGDPVVVRGGGVGEEIGHRDAPAY